MLIINFKLGVIMHYKKVKKHKRKVMIKTHYRLGRMLKESKRLKKELFVESPI